jgi:hypothetical protein
MRIVLLDLEATVIDDWSSRNAMPENLEKIRSFLQPEDKLGLMSWAIWDAEDKSTFQGDLQLLLEDAVEHAFTQEFIFSMSDFSDIILKHCRKWVSKDDMFDLFGKEECLLKLVRLGWFPENCEVILIDDVVDHNLTFTKGSRSVRFINVEVFRHLW